MPFEPGERAFDLNHLHHTGTTWPDGTGWPDSSDDAITGLDGPYPFPTFALAIDEAPSPVKGDEASAVYAGDAAAAVDATAAAAQTGASAPSGLDINATYDSSITTLEASNPTLYADITGAITAAIDFYEANIINPVTINLDFGFGEVDGTPLDSDDLGESREEGLFQSYTVLTAELKSAATSVDDETAVANLPATDPTTGGEWVVADSELKALGVLPADSSEIDGYVGLSSTQSFTYNPLDRAVSGEYDAIGVLEHEISEAMGRLESLGTYFGAGEYTPLDLFRYSAPGTHELSPGAGYFSIDGGTTDLAQFNNPTGGGDAGDWANSVTDDSYDAFSFTGVANTVSATDLTVMDVLGYTLATACFAKGTRIATDHGMVPVEALREDDRVLTLLDGKLRPIVWLGHRLVDCKHYPDPAQVWPIRIGAGAFGPGRPYRDLLLSPDHAVFVDGALIPIRYLVNGRTVTQEARDTITYWHVELLDHDVICAEGLPTESYLDTGNRNAFANCGAVMDLHPDFARRVWATQGCAELVLDGPRLAAAKRRLLARASTLGHCTTDDPGLSVLADGSAVPVEQHGRVWRMPLPEATTHVRLVSRVWTPAHMQSNVDDTRLLGVAISRLWLDGCAIHLDGPRLRQGWHTRERTWRWTNGDACVATWGARALAFEATMTGLYWREEQEYGEARAA